jgi:LacI family transcriptional regulator
MTIIDIARISGFSKSTVSRVLKDDPNVKASTREKIQTVMRENNFIRSELAASMVAGSIRMVLIITGDIENPYYAHSVKKIEEVLAREGFMTILCNSGYDADKETRYLNLAAEFRFSGVIMMTAIESPQLYRILDRLHCPVVLLNRHLRQRSFDSIVQNNFEAAYSATDYLIKQGHRRILHLAGIKGASASEDRLAGYLKAMEDAAYEVRQDMIVYGDLTGECGMALAERLMADPSDITAVFIVNFAMAMGFAQRWWGLNKKIPDDISVISYDRTSLMDFMPVSISSVGVDSGVMGEEAANRILARINGDTGPTRLVILDAKLDIRGSVKSLL